MAEINAEERLKEYCQETARELLATHRLPFDLDIEFEQLDSGVRAGYWADPERIVLGPKATKFSILHEGAHAEHQRALSFADNLKRWTDIQTLAAALASEAYVGKRLGHVDGFIQAERTKLVRYPTVTDASARVATIQGFEGPTTPTNSTPRGVSFLKLVLPLVAAEQEVGDRVFSIGLPLPRFGTSRIFNTVLADAVGLAELDVLGIEAFASRLEQIFNNVGLSA